MIFKEKIHVRNKLSILRLLSLVFDFSYAPPTLSAEIRASGPKCHRAQRWLVPKIRGISPMILPVIYSDSLRKSLNLLVPSFYWA